MKTWLKKQAPERLDPKLAWRYKCNDYASYALAKLYLGATDAERTSINAYLNDIALNSKFDGNLIPQHQVGCSGSMPNLLRIVLDPALSSKIDVQVLSNLRHALYQYVYERSQIAKLGMDQLWTIYGSENHHSANYGSYYLALVALKASSPDLPMNDQHSISEHVVAWTEYWKAWIRGHAKEGLFGEVASNYGQYTMMTFYNIRDLSPDPTLRKLADQFITLALADEAQEFNAQTGVRGGAATRVYKNIETASGRLNQIFHLGYVYQWHDLAGAAAAPPTLIPLVSSYRPPNILASIVRGVKKPFHYVSRRIGAGAQINQAEIESTFALGSHGQATIRRDSYVTPEYIVGSMSWAPGVSFNIVSDQNRLVGVTDSSDPNARLMVLGIGVGKHPNPTVFGDVAGYAEISSVGYGNTLIVGHDPRASSNGGTQIYVSNAGNLWANSTITDSYSGKWMFTSSNGAYYAIRIASGSYTIHDGADTKIPGKTLYLTDVNTPVVIQMGRKVDYPSENAFRQKVMHQTQFTYADGQLTYTDVDGRTFHYGSESKPFNPNMPYTYFSPYLRMLHGEDTALIRYGKSQLELDFSY